MFLHYKVGTPSTCYPGAGPSLVPRPLPPSPPRLRLWTCTIKLEHLPPVNLVQHDPKLQQCNSTTVGIRKLFRENVVWPLKGSSLQINHERLPPQQLQQHHTTTTSCNCSFKSFHHVQGKKKRLLVITTLVE